MRDTSSDSDPQPEPKKDESHPQDKWFWEHTLYDELRKLVAAKSAHEQPIHSLHATALVHEAYVRLVEAERELELSLAKQRFGCSGSCHQELMSQVDSVSTHTSLH